MSHHAMGEQRARTIRRAFSLLMAGPAKNSGKLSDVMSPDRRGGDESTDTNASNWALDG